MTQITALSTQRIIDESKYIIRRVRVDRNQPPQEVLDATGRVQSIDSDVVESMPRGDGDEVEVILFQPEPWEYTRPGFMSDDDLEKCFERRSFIPADPYSIAGLNRDDLAFADENPHITHWKDADGDWCYATFHRWLGKRILDVNRHDCGWRGHWWFASLPKKTQC